MNGWQRIGVVTSVLWIVGLPLLIVVESNRYQGGVLSSCVATAYETSNGFPQESSLRTAERECLRRYSALSISPQLLLRLLTFKQAREQGVSLWATLLVPILLLWLSGGMVAMVIRFSQNWLTPQVRPTDQLASAFYSRSFNRALNRAIRKPRPIASSSRRAA